MAGATHQIFSRVGVVGEHAAAIAAYDEVIERFGGSDAPDLQELVALAMVSKGDGRVELGEHAAAIAAYDEVIERFGGSDIPDLQVPVAWALIDKGDTQRQRGEYAAAIAAYNEVIERFGGSDAPDLQTLVARAMVDKGDTQRQRGEHAAAIAAYDEVIERFGGSDTPELQEPIAWALVNKGMEQTKIGRAEDALHTCEDLEQRLGTLTGNKKIEFAWRAMWVRTKALLAQEKPRAAMEALRSAYDVFVHDNETMMSQMIQLVPDFVAAGASAHDLVEILSSDKVKSGSLAPLLVALRQYTGEAVRAPAEVLEVAADILTVFQRRKNRPERGDTTIGS